ncbi:nuclear transport factor 2 family protein [Burkholderia multivorans]|uniref:nuclear transport factor 2 family protein n=1 Tax=Burkholderia multivorans TaxID=87883 RepID=UPI002159A2CA|nr:nuclear transport factor 2 family protein [Burkholderia multivorans]MCA7956232.1 nuclear transport factor 2 family protein [Burkholderia multivorans]MDN7595848.1 nuclear transport factor 2 family protein [Burkholderia multivorans]
MTDRAHCCASARIGGSWIGRTGTASNHVAADLEIAQAHSRYARALDGRNWSMPETVSAPDVQVDYDSGEFRVDGRAGLVALIRSHLDGCGPTQHLLGTPHVEVGDGEVGARSRIYVRAASLRRCEAASAVRGARRIHGGLEAHAGRLARGALGNAREHGDRYAGRAWFALSASGSQRAGESRHEFRPTPSSRAPPR